MFTNLEVHQNSFVAKCSEEDLICAEGEHALENPYMITRCQHVFCRSCLAQEIQRCESLKCPKCLTRIKKDDIIFSSRDNARLKRIWSSTYRSEIQNPYVDNSGQDKKSIFGTRDFFDYEVVSSDIRCSRDSYSAKGKHFKGKVDARDGIKLHQCIVDGYTKTSMGQLKGSFCVFKGDIKARDGVELENSKGLRVETSMGKAKISGGSYGLIKAQDGVKLTNVNVDQVNTSMGKVHAENGNLGDIKARDGVTLNSIVCQSADVSMGKIIIYNTFVNGGLKARDGVQMDDSTAQSVKVSMGKAIISNPNKVGVEILSVEARDGVSLSHVLVPGNITSSMGSVEVFNSKVGSIEASETVKLNKSLADSVIINTSKKMQGGVFEARLELNGDIRGNVKVVVNDNILSGGILNTGSFVSNGNIVIINRGAPFSSTSCECSINMGSKKLQTKVSETIMNSGCQTSSYYDLKLDGASYPLSSSDTRLIRMWYKEPLDITSDGRITNTYGKIIKIGSQVFGREEPVEKVDNESSSKSNQPKCVLKITGSGIIEGKVEFIECEGEVIKDSAVTIKN